MKKVFVLVSCFAVVLILSKASFAQPEDAPASEELQSSIAASSIAASEEPQLSVKTITEESPSEGIVALPLQAVPFGYAPYPTTVDGTPAYGIPYSYPRAPRRLGNRLAPPPFQPHPLPPVPGVAPGAAPNAQPTVVYRPTPIRNFFTLMMAPRPYLGYDPYAAGYLPFPGYQPPQ